MIRRSNCFLVSMRSLISSIPTSTGYNDLDRQPSFPQSSWLHPPSLTRCPVVLTCNFSIKRTASLPPRLHAPRHQALPPIRLSATMFALNFQFYNGSSRTVEAQTSTAWKPQSLLILPNISLLLINGTTASVKASQSTT